MLFRGRQGAELIRPSPSSKGDTSAFRMSLVFTHVYRLLRREFRPLYLRQVPIHVGTLHSTSFLETFLVHDNGDELATPHRVTRASLVLHRPLSDGDMFVDIKSLVLLAQRFWNIVCTVARSGASPHRHKQRANRFLKRFVHMMSSGRSCYLLLSTISQGYISSILVRCT
jgi:hypothetical protein